MPTFNQITDEYVAGFFDGEGTIGIYANGFNNNDPTKLRRYRAKASVTQNSLPVLLSIQERFGGRLAERTNTTYDGTPRTQYTIHWDSRELIGYLVERILPFLIVKREAAEEVLSYCMGEQTARETRHALKGDADGMI